MSKLKKKLTSSQSDIEYLSGTSNYSFDFQAKQFKLERHTPITHKQWKCITYSNTKHQIYTRLYIIMSL